MLKKRDRVKAASPPPNFANRPRDMKVCLENGSIRVSSPFFLFLLKAVVSARHPVDVPDGRGQHEKHDDGEVSAGGGLGLR